MRPKDAQHREVHHQVHAHADGRHRIAERWPDRHLCEDKLRPGKDSEASERSVRSRQDRRQLLDNPARILARLFLDVERAREALHFVRFFQLSLRRLQARQAVREFARQEIEHQWLRAEELHLGSRLQSDLEGAYRYPGAPFAMLVELVWRVALVVLFRLEDEGARLGGTTY